jgi:hypothetical protein
MDSAASLCSGKVLYEGVRRRTTAWANDGWRCARALVPSSTTTKRFLDETGPVTHAWIHAHHVTDGGRLQNARPCFSTLL